MARDNGIQEQRILIAFHASLTSLSGDLLQESTMHQLILAAAHVEVRFLRKDKKQNDVVLCDVADIFHSQNRGKAAQQSKRKQSYNTVVWNYNMIKQISS
jgi:hypothetical protein